MPFVWNSSLDTGIREIDLQHRELVEMGNELEATVLKGDLTRALQDVLPRLNAYVLFHFGTEETMLAGVPGWAAHMARHVAEHRAFAEKVAALRDPRVSAEALLAFVDYLYPWLAEHIGKTDRELADLIRKPHGVPAART